MGKAMITRRGKDEFAISGVASALVGRCEDHEKMMTQEQKPDLCSKCPNNDSNNGMNYKRYGSKENENPFEMSI